MIAKEILRLIPQSIRTLRALLKLYSHDVSIQHLRVMKLVREGKGPTEMAEMLLVSQAAISKMLSGLENKKLLKRYPGTNKRSISLKLTTKGKKTLDSVFGQVEKKLDKGLELLSVKERKELESGLVILNKLMNTVHEV